MASTRIRIIGMNCPRCTGDLHAALSALPGVQAVEVHFEHGDATVEHDASVTRTALLETVESAGYDAV